MAFLLSETALSLVDGPDSVVVFQGHHINQPRPIYA